MLYFYIDAQGQVAGPVEKEALASCGVTLDTPVWHEGLADWVRAHAVAELVPLLPAPSASTHSAAAPSPLPSTTIEAERPANEQEPTTTPTPTPTCGYEPTENAASLAAAATAFGASEETPVPSSDKAEATSLSTHHRANDTDNEASSTTATPPTRPPEASPTSATETAMPCATVTSPTPSPTPKTHSVTTPTALRTSIEAVEQANLIENLDLWKWLNIGLVIFSILGMCCSLSFLALPCGVYGAIKAHDALRLTSFHDTPFFQAALKQSKKWFFIGCFVFAISLFLGVAVNWILK